MPIEVKDFTWKQSNDTVSVYVPLKGIHRMHVDILISEKYLKLHYPPFIFEVFLRHNINDLKSQCFFTDTEALLELSKTECINWEKLEADINKKEKVSLKLKIIQGIQEKTRKELDDKIKLKTELGRFAVSEAIELDSKRRIKIDALRDLERNKAMKDLEDWRQSEINSHLDDNFRNKSNKKSSVNLRKDSGIVITDITNEIASTNKNKDEMKTMDRLCNNGRSNNNETGVIISKITDNVNSKDGNQIKVMINDKKPQLVEKKSIFYTKVMSDIETRKIPSPRQSSTLNVSFTARVFPTPCRESSAKDEEIWLKNINEARRATGFVSEDLRPEEQDPQWCKEKGDSFFRSANYLGAISAYSHAIKLSDKLPSLYANRSACHMALGNFHKCIEDTSHALELLTPPCAANLSSRVKCITRRAAALTRVGLLNKGIEEMKAAVRLQPDNEDLKMDLFNMERAWEQDPDSD